MVNCCRYVFGRFVKETLIENMYIKADDFCCSSKVPSYVINLDLPPEERWNQVGKDYAAEVGICLLE